MQSETKQVATEALNTALCVEADCAICALLPERYFGDATTPLVLRTQLHGWIDAALREPKVTLVKVPPRVRAPLFRWLSLLIATRVETMRNDDNRAQDESTPTYWNLHHALEDVLVPACARGKAFSSDDLNLTQQFREACPPTRSRPLDLPHVLLISAGRSATQADRVELRKHLRRSTHLNVACIAFANLPMSDCHFAIKQEVMPGTASTLCCITSPDSRRSCNLFPLPMRAIHESLRDYDAALLMHRDVMAEWLTRAARILYVALNPCDQRKSIASNASDVAIYTLTSATDTEGFDGLAERAVATTGRAATCAVSVPRALCTLMSEYVWPSLEFVAAERWCIPPYSPQMRIERASAFLSHHV